MPKPTAKTAAATTTKKTLPTTASTSVTSGSAPTTAASAISAALSQIDAALTSLGPVGLVTLTAVERRDSSGKLRDGEAAAMLNVLDAVDAYPGLFASLADKDGGVDDAVVETAPARADLATWTALAPVATKLEALLQLVADTMLSSAEGAKDVTGPAYAIIRANASSNAKLAKIAAPSMKFYAHSAKQRAANLASAAKKAKKAAAAQKS